MATREAPWLLRAAFVGGAAIACLVAGVAMDHGVLVWSGVGLFVVAYVLCVVADSYGDAEAPRPLSRAHILAGVIAILFMAALSAALSAVVAIFAGTKAFRWMAICFPVCAAWLLLSGATRRVAYRMARRATAPGHSSESGAKSTS